MDGLYGEWYDEFKGVMDTFDGDELFGAFDELLHSGKNTFAFNRKLMEKAIDVSWVEAIENGLVHVDNCLRTPRRTIEDVEEIVPIALSRKITVDSVKHLAQHTDYIQSVDKKTGKITPSKILNIHKEESLMTYENRFVNTLIDRLYIFINRRYEKLAQVAKDEQVFTLGYDADIDDGAGGKMRVEVKLETTESLDKTDADVDTPARNAHQRHHEERRSESVPDAVAVHRGLRQGGLRDQHGKHRREAEKGLRGGFLQDRHNEPAAFEHVESVCMRHGLFIVPVGEMECFDKTINKEKKEWVYSVLQEYDLANEKKLTAAREFVQGVLAY